MLSYAWPAVAVLALGSMVNRTYAAAVIGQHNSDSSVIGVPSGVPSVEIYQRDAPPVTQLGPVDAPKTKGNFIAKVPSTALKQQEDFYWGTTADNTAFGSITAIIQDPKQRIVFTKAFSEWLKSAGCSTSNPVLTFNDAKNLAQAQKDWAFLNTAGNSVYVVVESTQCKTPDQRQPYLATKVTFDTKALTASFTATADDWSGVIKERKIAFDTRGLSGSSGALQKRGETSIAKTVKLKKFDVNFSGVDISLTPSIISTGTADAEFHQDSFFSAPKGSISLNGFSLDATFDLGLSGSLKTAFSKTLPLLELPIAAIAFGPVTLGVVLDIESFVDISNITASADLTFGVKASWEDGIGASFDLSGADKTQITGNWNPTFDLQKPVLSGKVSVTADAGIRTKLPLELKIAGEALGVGFEVVAPKFVAVASAEASTAGTSCNGDAASVSLKIDADFEVDAFATLGKTDHTISLAKGDKNLFDGCTGIGGSGGDSGSGTSAPPLDQSILINTYPNFCSDTPIPVTMIQVQSACQQLTTPVSLVSIAGGKDLTNTCVVTMYEDLQCASPSNANIGPISAGTGMSQCIGPFQNSQQQLFKAQSLAVTCPTVDGPALAFDAVQVQGYTNTANDCTMAPDFVSNITPAQGCRVMDKPVDTFTVTEGTGLPAGCTLHFWTDTRCSSEATTLIALRYNVDASLGKSACVGPMGDQNGNPMKGQSMMVICPN